MKYILLLLMLLSANKISAQTDTIAPLISLLGAKCIKVCVATQYADSGYVVSDNVDDKADLEINLEGSFVTKGTANTGVYKLRFSAKDKTGNIGYSDWRIINVRDSADLPDCLHQTMNCDSADSIAPVITLVGDPAASVCRCCPHKEEGYIATDNIDSAKNITIIKEGSILTQGTKLEGVYTLRYKAIDRAGNISYSRYRYIFVQTIGEFPCADNYCCVSLEENSFQDKFKIYPNPAQNEIFIETAEHVISISIYSVSGHEINNFTVNRKLNSPYKIDTKHFPAGVYMVKVASANGVMHKKVTVRR